MSNCPWCQDTTLLRNFRHVLSLYATLLGLKVFGGRSGVSLLLQKANTPLLCCIAYLFSPLLSPPPADLSTFIASLPALVPPLRPRQVREVQVSTHRVGKTNSRPQFMYKPLLCACVWLCVECSNSFVTDLINFQADC